MRKILSSIGIIVLTLVCLVAFNTGVDYLFSVIENIYFYIAGLVVGLVLIVLGVTGLRKLIRGEN